MADEDDDWSLRSDRLSPEFTGDLLPADPAREFDEEETLKFFGLLAEGYGPLTIGLSMGWSPAMVNRFMKEPSRAEIIAMITESVHESVEHAILQGARTQNSTAMKLYAYNKMGHRGWADRREVRQVVSGSAEVVVSVREALSEHTRERVALVGEGAIAELQEFLGEFNDADIIEAEVVEQ